MKGGRDLKDVSLTGLKYGSRLKEELKQPSFLCQIDPKVRILLLEIECAELEAGQTMTRLRRDMIESKGR